MRYLSVCSGIEAATVAWHPLGWQPWAFSEIEAFPSAVLAHHYPTTPNLGDMTRFKDWPDAAIDLLVGGTPCQSFSVAGLRKGLGDPRGSLMLTYLAIARRYRPRWVAWENVPGVLSSDGGRAFGSLLGGLAELGYGFAYRILDAQYAGLAQRRQRVFVVGHLGDWRRAAAVLFERESLSGHPAPRREAGEEPAPCLGAGPVSGGRKYGTDADSVKSLIAHALNAKGGSGRSDYESETFIAHSLRADCFDASEDGTGRGTPLVPISYSLGSHAGAADADASNRSHASGGPSGMGIQEDVSHSLRAGRTQAVAFMATESFSSGNNVEIAPTLRVGTGLRERGEGPSVAQGMNVRRLTPRECERLQGFPDDFTLIPYRGKPAADGPRYKALGNSMAVPVMAWIGRRIQMVESLDVLEAVS